VDDTQCGSLAAAVCSAYLLSPAGTARLSALVCAAHRMLDIQNKGMSVAVQMPLHKPPRFSIVGRVPPSEQAFAGRNG
jgi:hypothetical protein